MSFTTSEGTWLSLDLSNDGRTYPRQKPLDPQWWWKVEPPKGK
jgi:hypothetical protein